MDRTHIRQADFRRVLSGQALTAGSNLPEVCGRLGSKIVEILSFEDEQIAAVLAPRIAKEDADQLLRRPEVRDLLRRPLLTELVIDVLPDVIDAGGEIDQARIYLYVVRKKLDHHVAEERTSPPGGQGVLPRRDLLGEHREQYPRAELPRFPGPGGVGLC
jgi:hypothetical protein